MFKDLDSFIKSDGLLQHAPDRESESDPIIDDLGDDPSPEAAAMAVAEFFEKSLPSVLDEFRDWLGS